MATNNQSQTAKKLEISNAEVKDYIREQKKANRRIANLQKAGLEPRILTFVMSALDAANFPNISSIGTHHEFINTFNVLKRFNRNVTGTVRGARVEEQKRYDNFVQLLQQATGEKMADEVYRVVFPFLGGIDWNDILTTYIYEEVVLMMSELYTRGVSPTNYYVKKALDDGIFYAMSDYLSSYIPRDFIFDTGNVADGGVNQIRDFEYYVQFAINNNVQAAINEYNIDKQISEMNSYDFMV